MKNSLFGTDGIRGVVGQEPFTPTSIERIGRALAQWSRTKLYTPSRVLIASDTRASCPQVKEHLMRGLAQPDIAIIDAQILATPIAYWFVSTSNQADWGIVISASHNPHRYNGIKVIAPGSLKLSAEDERAITNMFYALPENIETSAPVLTTRTDIEQLYLRMLDSFFPAQFLRGKTIALDCAQGATYHIAPEVFHHFGATVHSYFAEPNGTNINDNCGAVHPQGLQAAVLTHHANIGFAFDGDGDRVTAVNSQGIVKDGDDILALLAKHPRYAGESAVVGTIVSNQGLAAHLATHGKKLFRANVGDKHVHACMHENNLLVGGEPSGHVIVRDYLGTGDGIFTALRIAEASILTNNSQLESFTKFPLVSINVPIGVKKDLATEPFAGILKQCQDKLPQGRLVVRYSGTEPLLRIVVEDQDHHHAQTIAENLSKQLRELLVV